MLTWLWNSVKIGLIASAGILPVDDGGLRFRGCASWARDRCSSAADHQMFPAALTVIALYTIFDALGNITPALRVDSHWSLILAYLSGITPHLDHQGYFDSIDPAMDKAAP